VTSVLSDSVQEVPCLSFDLDTGDLHSGLEYSMVPGYEDLGVFYTENQSKTVRYMYYI